MLQREQTRFWMVVLVLIIFLIPNFVCFSDDSADVKIKEVEGRKEALVSLNKSSANKPSDGKIKKTLNQVGKDTYDVMDASNQVIARGTDKTVSTIQVFGENLFSWIFKKADTFRTQVPSNERRKDETESEQKEKSA